jgi:hypothetical protein
MEYLLAHFPRTSPLHKRLSQVSGLQYVQNPTDRAVPA